MYTKVWFPRIRFAYNKCILKFDFLENGMLITNAYQNLIS